MVYHGQYSFEFPNPEGVDYEDYDYEVREIYDFSGLAFEKSWLDVVGPTGRRDNVKRMSFDKLRKKLYVTWRVDEAHWSEFVSNGVTYGEIELEVKNLCPISGIYITKKFPLIVELVSQYYDQDR